MDQQKRLVSTAHEALTIWGEECAASGESVYGPRRLGRRSPMVGESHERQVVTLVETTSGVVEVYDALRRVYQQGLPPLESDVARLEAFSAALEKRLPWRSVPKREPDCAADLPLVVVPGRKSRGF